MRGIDRNNITEWFRICPECGKNVYHKNQNSLRVGTSKNCSCWECKQKHQSDNIRGRRWNWTNQFSRVLCSISHKNSEKWKASMNTPEYKEKHRLKLERMRKENKVIVCFNDDACKVFDFINSKLNWNGHHAKNQKEVVVENFYLDFYEPKLNIAIEWDEKYHKKPNQKRLDYIKQKFVMKKLNCEFYRVDDTNKTVRKIHSTCNDKTDVLQSIINEYYEKTASNQYR